MLIQALRLLTAYLHTQRAEWIPIGTVKHLWMYPIKSGRRKEVGELLCRFLFKFAFRLWTLTSVRLFTDFLSPLWSSRCFLRRVSRSWVHDHRWIHGKVPHRSSTSENDSSRGGPGGITNLLPSSYTSYVWPENTEKIPTIMYGSVRDHWWRSHRLESQRKIGECRPRWCNRKKRRKEKHVSSLAFYPNSSPFAVSSKIFKRTEWTVAMKWVRWSALIWSNQVLRPIEILSNRKQIQAFV